MTHSIKWLAEPEEHDFPAAFDCISMEYGEEQAAVLVEKLRAAEITHRKAKDIVRMSRDTPHDAKNKHVKHNLDKIAAREPLSPVLLVSGKPLLVADGWHRVSAIHLLDEDALIPCKIV